MAGRVSLLVLVCGLALASVACEKIPTSYEERGLTFIDAIPADVGTLVGVTPVEPEWVSLWYQKPNKDIVIVTVNSRKGLINADIMTIPRK